MKCFFNILFVVTYLFYGSGCNQIIPDQHIIALQPTGQAWGALYQRRAAEYKALAFQAYNIAQLRLDQRLKKKSEKPLAIITDIDETVLDNTPFFTALARQKQLYDDSLWVKWTALIKCDTIPGAVRFLKYATSKGVAIFYITNRLEQERSATLRNLAKWDIPQATNSHLFLMGSNDSKEQRRLQIEKSYEIALLLGDSLGDFDKLFDHLTDSERTLHTQQRARSFGEKFIVLPNAMYGTWEDVLYKDKKAGTIDEKNEILTNALK